MSIHLDDVALDDELGSLTYGDMCLAAERLALELDDAGIPPHSRIVAALPNGRQLAALIFAGLFTGRTIVPIGTNYSATQFAELLADCDAAALVSERPLVGHSVNSSGVVPKLNISPLGRRAGVTSSSPGVAFLFYTSGSTGRPRAVICPIGQVLFATEAIHRRLRYIAEDRIYNALSPAFDYGVYQYLLAARAGATLICRTWDRVALTALKDIRDLRATVLPLVPAIAAATCRLGSRSAGVIEGVRLITNTGGHLGSSARVALRGLFPQAHLQLMYGLTECKRVSISGPDEDLRDPDGAGHPLAGTAVWTIDAQGCRLPLGRRGELVIAGPNVAAGYWRDPELTAQRYGRMPDGTRYVRSGDLGVVTESGSIQVLGRMDDQVKIRGTRVASGEIEALAVSIEGVYAAKVLAGGEPEYIALHVETEASVLDVRKALLNVLGSWKMPDRVVVHGQLPRTERGKIDRAAIAALHDVSRHDG